MLPEDTDGKPADRDPVVGNRRRLSRCLVVLLVVVAVVAAVQVYLWRHRPMFHNSFCHDEKLLGLHRWVLEFPPICDRSECSLLADHDRNILAFFDVRGTTLHAISFPRETTEGAVFHTDRWLHKDFEGEDLDFVVPCRANALFAFHANGSRDEFPLAPGEAKRIFRTLRKEQWDLAGLLHRSLPTALAELYARDHSPAELASLKKWLDAAAPGSKKSLHPTHGGAKSTDSDRL